MLGDKTEIVVPTEPLIITPNVHWDSSSGIGKNQQLEIFGLTEELKATYRYSKATGFY